MRFSRSLYVFVVSAFFAFGICTATDPGLSVSVDIKQKSANSLKAKEKALKDAARKALNKLLSEEFGDNRNEKYSDEEISSCIQNYSIDAEKFSDSLYIAKISYKFNRAAVENLLNKNKSTDGYEIKTYGEEDSLKQTKVAIKTRDFLKNYSRLKQLSSPPKHFSSEYVILTVKGSDMPIFKRLSIKYEKCN